MRHLLGIESLSRQEIERILDTSEAMLEISQREIKRVPTLRGRTVINLFLEPSTRTRVSFEIAAKRLSADAINVSSSESSMIRRRSLERSSDPWFTVQVRSGSTNKDAVDARPLGNRRRRQAYGRSCWPRGCSSRACPFVHPTTSAQQPE